MEALNVSYSTIYDMMLAIGCGPSNKMCPQLEPKMTKVRLH